ncbi:HD domain-containing protein [Candidatus Uhrbacteria bacterium]|jgi:putative hydrolases of HD superfamily|nr:HD domain-containing protein [Candidatus Uhrbacteria bacterium]
MNKRTVQIIDFLKTIEAFKTIEREIPTSAGRPESDAEHSWHLAMFLIAFQAELPPTLNMQRALELALMHDLVEIYAGDTFAFDIEGRKTKKDREERAAVRLFDKLPDDIKERFTKLFREYEDQTSIEAQIVKALDKLQPSLVNSQLEGGTWAKHDLSYEKIMKYKRQYVEPFPFIESLMDDILQGSVNEGHLSP